MKLILALAATLATPIHAAASDAFDPDRIDVGDAIACRIDAPSYTGFALSIDGDDGIAAKRHWRIIKSASPFMVEYELPEPIIAASHYSTRRIAFTASAVLAILDVNDPSIVARAEKIENAADPEPLIAALVASGKAPRAQVEANMPFRKFLGERVMVDVTEPAAADKSFGTHTIVARSISNATTHPGKTFYGCSYSIQLIGKDGKPL